MIIEALLNLIYGLMSVLMVLNIPDMPAEVQSYINSFFDYLASGVGIVANYVPLDYLLVLFGVILAVDVGIMLYHFIMWIIKKIPMLNVK